MQSKVNLYKVVSLNVANINKSENKSEISEINHNDYLSSFDGDISVLHSFSVNVSNLLDNRL